MSADLLSVIRAVRRRWRMRLLLRGLAIVLAGGFLAFLLATWGADRFRFAPTPLAVLQVLAWGAAALLAYRYLVRPLARRVSDEQVALYLEEHEPTLDGEVLSAVVGGDPRDAAVSPALVERIVRRAVLRLDEVERGRRIERAGLRRSGGMLASATGVAVLVLLFGPASLRTGLPLLVSPLGGSGSTPYAIGVVPGDTTLARGADLRIQATLRNFTAEDVTLVLRPAGATTWERVTMTLDAETGAHGALLFDLQDSTEYFVSAGGVRSAVHRLAVADLPYVDSIALEYHFPDYTGLEPVRQDEGGDVAALVDTRVTVTVTPTMPVSTGALAVGADTLPLRLDSAGLTGELTVRENGSYRVLLAGPDGRLVPASPEYFIDALADQPPTIRIDRPGRDVTVTSVDELFLEVVAEDDFGLTSVELVIAVNGGADSAVSLYRGRGRLKDLSAGHTMYLEERGLQPGDVIAYFARARDARRGGEPAATDIYFARIRPYDQRWRAAEASGGEQGAGGGMSPGELSRRQREIVAATFRLVRDKARYADPEWRDNLSTVTLMQGRLREEVETLVRRIESRGVVELDSTMTAVAAALPPAVDAMQEAEERLGRRQGAEALPSEQRALQYLQRAEAAFRDRQVTQGQQQGGGGGGGGGEDNAEELAQLFQLELDRLRNQYEGVERGRREETGQAVDEAVEKLRELARRQQQENERLRAQAQGSAGAAAAGSQRRLAEQAEELARQLERLSREQNDESLSESARRVREAADAMRRAAAGQGGTAQGNQAADRLNEARRQLEGSRSAGLRRDLEDALRRAERLAEQQGEVRQDVAGLSQAGQAREERLRRLSQRKTQMAEEVKQLESELDRLSREARGEQPGAADRLRETARAARDTRLGDKIKYSQGVARERSQEYADAFEQQIADDIDAMRRGIADAAGQVRDGGGPEREVERALDRTREITRALESLGERARESTGDSGAGAGAGGRQLRRELRERLGQLGELRDQLRGQGLDTGPIEGILDRLGRMDSRGTIGTPRGLDELEQVIVQGLKEYEFTLRRQLLGGDTPPGALTAGEDVPPEYRAMVDEYYRRLSERRR